MKFENVQPSAASLMESTRSIGYSLESAIADIIDNSIAADASNIQIRFPSDENLYIAIMDNGCGMTYNELKKAMQYGSRSPSEKRADNDLGRYGLGLKTASLSQCKTLTVISKKNYKVTACRWDLSYIQKKDKWLLQILEKDEINNLPCFSYLENLKSGTIVLWQNLDRLLATGNPHRDILGSKMIKVREHLSLVFHRYLEGVDVPRKISIDINNMEVLPKDPFLSKRSTKAMAEEVITIEGQQVVIRPYILPHISKLSKSELESLGGQDGLRKLQGFYVYRNKRLVVWGTWFRMMVKGDLSKLARIQVDIPNTLDELWTLDIKKSSAIPPELVQQNLKTIIEKIAEKSKRTWEFRGKKEQDNKFGIWERLRTRDNGYTYQINLNSPIIRELLANFPKAKRSLIAVFSLIGSRLPLNSLYLDLVQEQKIQNNDEQENETVLQQMQELLSMCKSIDDKRKMLKDFLNLSPFSEHKDFITQNIERILKNE